MSIQSTGAVYVQHSLTTYKYLCAYILQSASHNYLGLSVSDGLSFGRAFCANPVLFSRIRQVCIALHCIALQRRCGDLLNVHAYVVLQVYEDSGGILRTRPLLILYTSAEIRVSQ
jgi:hypothetical protein